MIAERYPFGSQHSLVPLVPGGFTMEDVVQSHAGSNHLLAHLLSQAGAIYKYQWILIDQQFLLCLL